MNHYDYSVHYGRFHDDSEEHAEYVAGWTAGLLKPHLPPDKNVRILDVGCGYGFALRALRKLGYTNITGLEASVQQAERCRAAGFEVEVTDDSAAWLRCRPEQFDVLLMMDVLEHVPVEQQIDFARATLCCLRPGGRLYMTVPNANAILSARWRYIDFTHHTSFTEHSLYFVLKNAGFDDINMNSSKGLGRFPRPWRRSEVRKWAIRWCWLQVFRAEVPWERIEDISFELNLTATAIKRA